MGKLLVELSSLFPFVIAFVLMDSSFVFATDFDFNTREFDVDDLVE